MKSRNNTWGNKVKIFTTVQMICKDTLTYIKDQLEWYCASGTFKKHAENALYLYNTENMHFDPTTGFKILLFEYLSYNFAWCVCSFFHVYLN